MKPKYRGVKEKIETMVLLGGIYPRFTTVSIVPEKETYNCKNISRNWISMTIMSFIDSFKKLSVGAPNMQFQKTTTYFDKPSYKYRCFASSL